MYSLGGFDVTGCNQNYRLFDSPRLFRFSDSTEFEELMGVDMLLLDSQVSYLTLLFVPKQSYFTG